MLLHKSQVSPVGSAERRAQLERIYLPAGSLELIKPEWPNLRDLNQSIHWAKSILPVSERRSASGTGNTFEHPT